MPRVSIRKVSVDEDEEVFDSLHSIYEKAYPQGTSPRRLRSSIEDPYWEQFIAELEHEDGTKKALGSGQVRYDSVGDRVTGAELTGAAVLPQVQGKGIGSGLFSSMLKNARQKSEGPIYTKATADPGAQAIAGKHGFLPSGLELNSFSAASNHAESSILMMDPASLIDRKPEIYTTPSSEEFVESYMETEIGEVLDRSTELLDPPKMKQTGYITEVIDGEFFTSDYGIETQFASPEIPHGWITRRPGAGTIDDIFDSREYRNSKHQSFTVNMNAPDPASAIDYLIDEGYSITGYQPDYTINPSPVAPESVEDFIADTVTVEKVPDSLSLEVTKPVADWAETCIPELEVVEREENYSIRK